MHNVISKLEKLAHFLHFPMKTQFFVHIIFREPKVFFIPLLFLRRLYLQGCHYWLCNWPYRWACCQWIDSSCNQQTACYVQENLQVNWEHLRAAEGRLNPTT